MKFNSQICTTREQSERLLALGLKKETADMCWLNHALTEDYKDWRAIPIFKDWEKWLRGGIPAWSLHRLIEMMPKSIYHNKADWYKVIYNSSVCYERGEYCCYRSCEIDLYVDIINCIEWLIKEGYFNKEYLL